MEWKFKSEEEFKDYAIDYMVKHIKRIKKIAGEGKHFANNANLLKEIKTFDKKFEKLKISTDESDKDYIITLALPIVTRDVNDWKTFAAESVSSKDYKSIITRALLSTMYDCNYICYDMLVYECEYLPIELVRDLIYISTNRFNADDYFNDNADVINKVILKVLYEETMENEEKYEIYRHTPPENRFTYRFTTNKLEQNTQNKLLMNLQES